MLSFSFYIMLKTLLVKIVYTCISSLSVCILDMSVRNLGGLCLCICALGLAKVSCYCWCHASSCLDYRQLLATLSDSQYAIKPVAIEATRILLLTVAADANYTKCPFRFLPLGNVNVRQNVFDHDKVATSRLQRVEPQRSVAPSCGQNVPRAPPARAKSFSQTKNCCPDDLLTSLHSELFQA